MHPDPVSWKMIEPGWVVVGRDGETLGRVRALLGDGVADIFSGLVVSHGLLRPSRHVPSERVAAIYEGLIEVDFDEAQFESLDEHATGQPGV
jgi:hypothetical protein